MSGFLHSLAARTLGLAPRIRPRATLPYATPPANLLDADLPDATLQVQPVTADATPADGTASVAPPSSAGRGQAQRWAPLPNVVPAGPPTGKSSPAPHPAGRFAAATDSAAQPAVAEATPIQPERLAAAASLVAALPALQTGHGLRPQATRDTPGQHAAPARSNDLDRLINRLLGPDNDDSQGLLPPLVPVTVPASAGASASADAIRTHASQERPLGPVRAVEPDTAPEVHITIGRLEVNPPSRPTPAPAPSPRGPAPLSLSDYLARRDGGRS